MKLKTIKYLALGLGFAAVVTISAKAQSYSLGSRLGQCIQLKRYINSYRWRCNQPVIH